MSEGSGRAVSGLCNQQGEKGKGVSPQEKGKGVSPEKGKGVKKGKGVSPCIRAEFSEE